MINTKVKELMTEDPELISPDTSIQEAAKKMERIDCGILPVGTANQLQGIITDRDIVIRALSRGKYPNESVSSYMTKEVFTCNEDDNLTAAADIMHKHKVSRLVVINNEGKICGILSFGGILRKDASAQEISEVVSHAVNKKIA